MIWWNMKKNKINSLLTVIAAAALFCLSGCGLFKSEPVNTDDKGIISDIADIAEQTVENEVLPDISEPEKENNYADLITDMFSDRGTVKMYYDDENAYDYAYSCIVPMILDDTEAAKEVNEQLEGAFKSYHDKLIKAAETGKISAEDLEESDWYLTTYEVFQNGPIASIIISCEHYYSGDILYTVYNYDFEEGKLLNNAALLEKAGMDMEECIKGLRRAAAYEVDASIKEFFESEIPTAGNETEMAGIGYIEDEVQQMYVYFLKCRFESLSAENIDQYTPMYLDNSGEVTAIVSIKDMGQYGEHQSMLQPKQTKNRLVKDGGDDIVCVDIREDGVYIKVSEAETAPYLFDVSGMEYNTDYKIDGLFKNYIDAAVSWVGNGMQPYVLLLSDDGMISYVDICLCANSGYFSAVEPLWGMYGIKSFEEMEGRPAGRSELGGLIDVEDALYLATTAKYSSFERDIMGLESMGSYSTLVDSTKDATSFEVLVGFMGDDDRVFRRESYVSGDNSGSLQEGYAIFNGMTDRGIVIAFTLTTESEDYLRGAMAVNEYAYWDEMYMDFDRGAVIYYLGGYDIFECEYEFVVCSVSAG